RILEVIERDRLIDRSAELGAHLLDALAQLATRHGAVSDVRGRGLMCALTLPSTELRDAVLARLRTDERVLMLGSGARSVRFRPALTVTPAELDRGVAALDRVLGALAG